MYSVMIICEDGWTYVLNCNLGRADAIAVRDGFNAVQNAISESYQDFEKAYVVLEERSY